MELCETCTKIKCNKNIVTIKKEDITIIKCLDYEKDENKIQGYTKPKERTAKFGKTVMGLYNPSWN